MFAELQRMDEQIQRLRRMLEGATRAVVFTGAGISTESGIPDYRSPGGIWMSQKPIYFRDFLASEQARIESWRRRVASDPVLRAARPNRGHVAVAQLVAEGKATAVITQNIDGLHQMSGVPDDKVIELHGNTSYAACLDCSTRYKIADVFAVFEREPRAPRCEHCGGFVKTATISFGQAMPAGAMRRAEQEARAADLFLSIGSSLVVYPAAGFPELARRNGAQLVIINREPTPLDEVADLVLRGGIGEALGTAVGVQ